MKRLLMLIAALAACATLSAQDAAPSVETLSSPDGNLSLKFTLTEKGEPCYWLDYKDKSVILPSTLGYEFRGRKASPKFEYAKNPLAKIEEFFNTPADKPVSEIYKPCIYPYSNMMITPAGDVYPCLSQKIGNVKEMSIKEAFNLPHYRCFRKNLKAAKVFGACQMCCELCVK